jgi:hypothetical protein
MKNIRNKIYNHMTNSIVSHYTIQQRLIPDRPYDFMWSNDRARRIVDYLMKHGGEVFMQCNASKVSVNNKL